MMDKTKVAVVLTGASLLSIVIGVGIGYLLFGNGIKTSEVDNANAAASSIVCDDGIVARYNSAMQFERRGDSDTLSVDTEALRELLNQIKQKAEYETDATCQTIVFLGAVEQKDYDSAKSALAAVKELHKQHKFADSNIRTTASLADYDSVLDTVSPTYGSREESAGGGGL